MTFPLLKNSAFAAAMLIMAAPLSAQSSNEAAIRQVQAQQEQAWNAHDAHAFGQLFADNAEVIDVLGSHWQGRSETEAKLASAFGSVLANSRLQIDDVRVRPLSDSLALAYVSWSMTGAMGAEGAAQHGIQTQLLQKADGRWLIASFQNTIAMPERPVSMAAAPAAAAPAGAMAAGASPTTPVAAPPAQARPATPAEPDNRGCLLGSRNSCWIRKKG